MSEVLDFCESDFSNMTTGKGVSKTDFENIGDLKFDYMRESWGITGRCNSSRFFFLSGVNGDSIFHCVCS